MDPTAEATAIPRLLTTRSRERWGVVGARFLRFLPPSLSLRSLGHQTRIMTWTVLSSQGDLDDLLKLFGNFHDGCLREAHVWTEHYVYPNLHMHCFGDLDTRVRLLVQSQYRCPSAIELLFEQVTTFHLQPSAANYDSIITGLPCFTTRRHSTGQTPAGGYPPKRPATT